MSLLNKEDQEISPDNINSFLFLSKQIASINCQIELANDFKNVLENRINLKLSDIKTKLKNLLCQNITTINEQNINDFGHKLFTNSFFQKNTNQTDDEEKKLDQGKEKEIINNESNKINIINNSAVKNIASIDATNLISTVKEEIQLNPHINCFFSVTPTTENKQSFENNISLTEKDDVNLNKDDFSPIFSSSLLPLKICKYNGEYSLRYLKEELSEQNSDDNNAVNTDKAINSPSKTSSFVTNCLSLSETDSTSNSSQRQITFPLTTYNLINSWVDVNTPSTSSSVVNSINDNNCNKALNFKEKNTNLHHGSGKKRVRFSFDENQIENG